MKNNGTQQGFCNSGAEVLNFSICTSINICAKLNICALNAPPSQSPKPLPAIALKKNSSEKLIFQF